MNTARMDHHTAISTTAEAAASAAGLKVAAGGGAAGLFGYLIQGDGVGLIGLMIAIAGFILNAWFNHRRDRREQAADRRAALEHAARMRAMGSTPEV